MKRSLVLLLVCLAAPALFAQEKVFDSMDDAAAWKVGDREKANITVEADDAPAEGKGAVKILVGETTYAITYKLFTPDPAWNDFDGFSFKVKGDGSENFGCIRIQAGSWNKAWLGNFPLKDTNWHEVKLAWRDLVPSGTGLAELGAADGCRPSDINLVAFGKSWNFTTKHTRPKIGFSIDDFRLVKGIEANRPRAALDKFPPVSSVAAKMKAGEPVTILALGDSITWGTNVGGNANSYPDVLGAMLRKHFGNDKITVVNRAIGGSTTGKGRQWLNRDVRGVQADLVTIMFGFNEMTAEPERREAATKAFVANLVNYAEETAGVMKAPPALVLLATVPGRSKHWETLDCYAEGVRAFGRTHANVTVADVNAAFKAMGQEACAKLMSDEAHPNREGQREMAKVVFQAITGAAPTAEEAAP